MPSDDMALAIRRIRTLLTPPPKVEEPVLVILSGLPGSGKTTFAAKLSPVMPALVVETDYIRKMLYSEPTYSGQENRFVHLVSRSLMRYYLRSGRSVIADATNLAEWHRQMLRRLAESCRVASIVVQTIAPEHVIAARLQNRSSHGRRDDFSDADWRVYQMLSAQVESIRGPHQRVDTTRDLDKSVKRILRAIQLARGPAKDLIPPSV